MAVRDPLAPFVHGNCVNAPDPAAPLGLQFNRPELLREALTHRSAVHDPHGAGARGRRGGQGSNERLEFVGDRVLGLVIAEWLAERFPKEQEGALGPRHAHLVSRPVLARIAAQIGLDGLLTLAPNESRAGVSRLSTVLADGMEAVIGALYFDSGLDAARGFIRAHWDTVMDAQVLPPKDAKTALQEWVLARGKALPLYEMVVQEGPPHAPCFTIAVRAAGQSGQGRAGSKREAERLAAADLLGRLT